MSSPNAQHETDPASAGRASEPVRYPTNHVLAIIDGPEQLRAAITVLTSDGAFVERVENKAPVVTYGQNDMVLDNWGIVLEWTARAPITSRGPSGIGMVQFGRLDVLRVDAPIETFGRGARGFNLYAGTMKEASFQSIRTHADGAIGIQVSRELPKLSVAGDVTTVGGGRASASRRCPSR
jgi:hypothetical protein